MPECCQETLCTHCIHREVCVHKEDYLALVRILQELRINKHNKDEIKSILVSKLAFCGEITAPCRFHRENLTELRGEHRPRGGDRN